MGGRQYCLLGVAAASALMGRIDATVCGMCALTVLQVAETGTHIQATAIPTGIGKVCALQEQEQEQEAAKHWSSSNSTAGWCRLPQPLQQQQTGQDCMSISRIQCWRSSCSILQSCGHAAVGVLFAK